MSEQRKPPYTATIREAHLIDFEPFTENQAKALNSWEKGKHLILSGSPGTGKTFLAFYLGLKEVLGKHNEFDKMIVIRSIVPTRDIGFLPGDETEKKQAYTLPYKTIAAEVTETPQAWPMLVTQKSVHFESTSFIRGLTLDNCIIVVDEMQNLTFHELDSVITRVGVNSRIIFCGDYHQSDLKRSNEKNGINEFLNIIDHMKDFDIVRFGWEDIVRSDFVRDYIMTKEMLQDKKHEMLQEKKKNEKASNCSGS